MALKQILRGLWLSGLSGLLAGLSSTLFLYALEFVTGTRKTYPCLIIGLPLIGFLIGWMYHVYGREVSRGNNLIIDEIHDPKKTIPVRMAPLIFIGTVLTHLFGGSAGREGTAVQMSAAFSDEIARRFQVSKAERRTLLMTGAGAGFAAAIGAPIAGLIFGLEVITVGRFKVNAF
ncbi:MAG: voltage-gated chloride channel protein, partial [Proteobacteria bacterium]